MPRPFVLDPLFRSLAVLPGVGPKNRRLFEHLIGGQKILDLLWHKPVDFVDRSYMPKLSDAQDGKICTVEVTVQKHFPPPVRSQPYKIWCTDETGTINIVYFHATKDWMEKQFPVGKKLFIGGRLEKFNNTLQIVHPDLVTEDKNEIEKTEPVYPLTAGLTNKIVRKAINGALPMLPVLEEWLDPALKQRHKWPDWKEAVETLHFKILAINLPHTPPQAGAIKGGSDDWNIKPHIQRLAYDELLANQLSLAIVRQKMRKLNGRAWQPTGKLHQKLERILPFKLTNAQNQALSEIDGDMKAPIRMLRLLQGDVGSGKTIVAAMAMMNVLECGAQAAIMAPTEILARQHALSFTPWLDAAGISHVVLTGRDKGKARQEILERIKNGTAQVVIGTHAIFQEGIEFNDLGLAVIDEQHKFGVHQRLQLSSKGRGTDVLVMTATPIPRTLTLTAYGDMEVSRLDEKPPGRKPIETRLIPIEKDEEMVFALERQMKDGARVYWVCPLVEENEKLDLQAAETRYDILKDRFGDKVGLIHGRMKPEEKDTVMAKFAAGETNLLVSTTVIEVGVNVPEATIMVIEQAERFGLAQLHQLRGRVGRGGTKSFCFLLYDGKLSESAKERLKIMRETEDGFLIAEKDLELRGGGEILGTRQSGLPEFRLAELPAHGDLLEMARDDAKLVLSRDPDLESARGKALRTLLYLFEQDKAISNLRAG
jgi:ATP-dependent DNA helicase RecG